MIDEIFNNDIINFSNNCLGTGKVLKIQVNS